MNLHNLLALVLALTSAPWATAAQSTQHTVRQLNGIAQEIRLPSKLQIVTEPWHRVVAVPSLAYMAEKDRLLMLIGCDYPHRAMLNLSDDRGTTWSEPRFLRLSEDLKRRGFKFVGSTICYAYMQAVGRVNDHLVDCFRHGELARKRRGKTAR